MYFNNNEQKIVDIPMEIIDIFYCQSRV